MFQRLGPGFTPLRLRGSAETAAREPSFNFPAVPQKLREKLMNITEYVDFTELLCPPEQKATSSKVQQDPDNPGAVLIVPAVRKELVTCYAGWMRAFYIFAACRTHYYLELRHPLLKYAEIIATLADPGHGSTVAEWMAYDARFRLHMSMNQTEHHLRSALNEQVWRESRFQVRVSAPRRIAGPLNFNGNGVFRTVLLVTNPTITNVHVFPSSDEQSSVLSAVPSPYAGSPPWQSGNKSVPSLMTGTVRHPADGAKLTLATCAIPRP